MEAGAEDCQSSTGGHDLTCAPYEFHQVLTALVDRFGDPESAQLTWKPQTTVLLDEETAQSLFKLLEVLEDDDDVQSVSANFEITDDVLNRLSAA